MGAGVAARRGFLRAATRRRAERQRQAGAIAGDMAETVEMLLKLEPGAIERAIAAGVLCILRPEMLRIDAAQQEHQQMIGRPPRLADQLAILPHLLRRALDRALIGKRS